MGQEAECTARLGEKVSKGKALLETDALVFRGAFRLVIPYKSMKSVTASQGQLQVTFPGGVVRLELGPRAAEWAEKILHPKSLLDKLGVKPGGRVCVVGVSEADFLRQLAGRAKDIAEGRAREESDLIFLAAEKKAALKRLQSLSQALKKTGAIWVIYPKGQAQITQADVMAASKQAGLVDIKVVRFSSTHTALKLVIPVARR